MDFSFPQTLVAIEPLSTLALESRKAAIGGYLLAKARRFPLPKQTTTLEPERDFFVYGSWVFECVGRDFSKEPDEGEIRVAR
ncbi:hypothetical protein COLO4_19694 [Corchorus olitorius]|uniref:Uncharacterized protein n=1 Tax=Corchorus olitorius TaxID=93759 RepID=A0A1R3J3Z5_9ROSI|nr:hypothetical protein COLO4_19694 [Corchorus olitorius]